MTLRGGRLVISLDFELHWGVRADLTVSQYRSNLLGVRDAIPSILSLFRRYTVHATWATVGMLFYATKADLLRGLPAERPAYEDRRLDPYRDLGEIGDSEGDDPFHYGASLLRQIAATPGQEIATHTFSHFFCLEHGASVPAFNDDLAAAQAAADPYDVRLTSLVLPGNQVGDEFVSVAERRGLSTYRGNPDSWLYRASARDEQGLVRRGARLIDAYVPLSGSNAYTLEPALPDRILDIPASRFLRPYIPRLLRLEQLRIVRITSDIEHAARHDRVYHLWWHPHNFGADVPKNIAVLETILRTFADVRERHGMQSLGMAELRSELLAGGG